MKTINLIIGFLALVLLLVILPGTAVGLISVWGLVGCIAGFVLCVVLARYLRNRKNSRLFKEYLNSTDAVTEDERAW